MVEVLLMMQHVFYNLVTLKITLPDGCVVGPVV